jgi:hypothetical protein
MLVENAQLYGRLPFRSSGANELLTTTLPKLVLLFGPHSAFCAGSFRLQSGM